MSGRNKGIIGEDIFATSIMIILIFFFILAVAHSYSNYLNIQDQVDRERRAASIAEWVFFSNGGVLQKSAVDNCNIIPSLERVGYEILNCKNNVKTVDRAVGSMPLLVRDGTDYVSARLVVYVYE